MTIPGFSRPCRRLEPPEPGPFAGAAIGFRSLARMWPRCVARRYNLQAKLKGSNHAGRARSSVGDPVDPGANGPLHRISRVRPYHAREYRLARDRHRLDAEAVGRRSPSTSPRASWQCGSALPPSGSTFISIETVARARRIHSVLATQMMHSAVEQFMPSIVAGILLTAVLAHAAPQSLWMLPGLWQILFSLGVFASCRSLPHGTFWVGVWYLATGMACLAIGPDVPASAWEMGIPFGVGHLLVAEGCCNSDIDGAMKRAKPKGERTPSLRVCGPGSGHARACASGCAHLIARPPQGPVVRHAQEALRADGRQPQPSPGSPRDGEAVDHEDEGSGRAPTVALPHHSQRAQGVFSAISRCSSRCCSMRLRRPRSTTVARAAFSTCRVADSRAAAKRRRSQAQASEVLRPGHSAS